LPFTFDLSRDESTSVTVSHVMVLWAGVESARAVRCAASCQKKWVQITTRSHAGCLTTASRISKQNQATNCLTPPPLRCASTSVSVKGVPAPHPPGMLWLDGRAEPDSAQKCPCGESYPGLPVVADHVTELSQFDRFFLLGAEIAQSV
jgi:hypothetical protein